MARRSLRVIALLAFVAAALGGQAQPVFAHAGLEASTPSANSVLEESPTEIVLDFDEAVEADLASISLFDGNSAAIELGAPAAGADDTVVQAPVPALDDGVYAVIWRVTSTDGHVIDGAFSFQVGTAVVGDGQQLIDEVRGGVRAEAVVRWWYGVARFLSLAGAICLIGSGWWLLRWPATLGRRGPRRMVAGAWLALLVGSAAAFGLFGAEAVAGSLADALSPSTWGDLATTQTGRMLLVRVVLAAVLGVLLLLGRQRQQGWWRSATFTASLFTLYTFSASGHPNSLEPATLWIAVDLVHLGAITVWIGGLFAIAISGRAALSEPDGIRMARRFSTAAAICVPLIIGTGVAQTLQLAGGLDDITATDWGRLLLTKVTVVVALLAVAGVSRWLLRHDGAASIWRTVMAEAALGMVVVGIAAGMVALPPEPPVAARPFAEQLAANGLIAIVSLSPGVVGGNEVHITVTPPGGSITPIASVAARVSLPSAAVPNAPVTLVKEGVNHYSGSVTFPRSGDWTLEVVIQVTATETALLSTTVPIP